MATGAAAPGWVGAVRRRSFSLAAGATRASGEDLGGGQKPRRIEHVLLPAICRLELLGGELNVIRSRFLDPYPVFPGETPANFDTKLQDIRPEGLATARDHRACSHRTGSAHACLPFARMEHVAATSNPYSFDISPIRFRTCGSRRYRIVPSRHM